MKSTSTTAYPYLLEQINMNKKILVLDSSGTITDALPERFLVAHNSYIRVNPTTNIFEPVELSASEFIETQNRFREIYDSFKKLNVYVQSGSDTYVIFRIIEDGIPVTCEEEFLRLKASMGADILNDYFAQFKQVRKELRESERDPWYNLQPTFTGIPEAIRQLYPPFGCIYVLTAKDSESVFELLKRYKLDDIISKENVAEAPNGKPAGLKELAQKHGADYNHILFVEDSLPNLKECSYPGVVSILAGWGYNNEQMRYGAIQKGIPIAMNANHLTEIIGKLIR